MIRWFLSWFENDSNTGQAQNKICYKEMSLEPVTTLCLSYEIAHKSAEPPGPRGSASFCPEGLMGGWGGTVHPVFDLHAVITFTNTHTRVMNEQTCRAHTTWLCKAHCKKTHTQRTRMLHLHYWSNQYWVSQAVWEDYWLLSRKGWSGQLINDPTGIQVKKTQ